MRTFFLSVLSLFLVTTVTGQELAIIQLNAPNKDRGSSIMKALSDRHSTREFSTENLTIQDLSDLLWAANGVNREDGRRTAPTARNNQDIDVYVIMEKGAYIYDAPTHELQPVAAGDFRDLVADRQDFAKDAPVSLLIVSDISRFTGLDIETQKQLGALDAGIVSQNIMLFASGCGLVTVPRAYMNKEGLKKALNLSETQIPMLNTPIGYTKEEKEEKKEIHSNSDVRPQFPGGDDAMLRYLTNNIKYPQRALKDGIQGRVIVKFVVSDKGKIKNIRVERPVSPECDEEAVRVIRSMPDWIPGQIDGKPVNVYYTIPILYKK